jgi:tetratricopeptide (TPR) repeat protein
MNKIIKLLLLLTFLFICVLNVFAQIDSTGGNQPLSLNDIKNAFATQKKTPKKVKGCNTPKLMSNCLIASIDRRGIFFLLTSQDENDLRKLDATDELIKVINNISADKNLANVDFELDLYDRTCEESCLTRAIATNEKALNQLVASRPNSVGTAYFNRGRILYRQKKYKEAIENILDAINNKFGGAIVLEFLGRNYYFDGNYVRAIENFNIAINLDNNFALAFNNRGNAFYFYKKEYDLAFKDYTKAIELNPNLSQAYGNRGNVFYYDKKEYDSAFKDYTKAIELDPNVAGAYNNRGLTFYFKKEYDLAIKDFDKAIELNPNYPEAYSSRGLTFYDKKEYDLAIKDFNKAIELNPSFSAAYNNRGVAFANKKEYDSAIKDYNKVIELTPNDAEAYYNLACLYSVSRKEENKDVAFRYLKIAIEKDSTLRVDAKTDTDLDFIRDDPRFAEIVGK